MNDRLKSSPSPEECETGLLPVGTFVMWICCIVVGLIGLFWPRLPAPVAPPKPVDAELLTIEATNQHPVLEESPPAGKPSPADVSAPPDMPTVVAPNPAIAFAEPVNAPVTKTPPPAAATQPAIIQLTLGEGEGDQPVPDYPVEAQLAGEEGTVVVSLTVNEDGQVTNAVAVGPCHWPILNSAAVRSLRSTWRFRRGPARVYRVSIVYQLKRHE